MKISKKIVVLLPMFFLVLACNWGHEGSENGSTGKSEDTSDVKIIEAASNSKAGVGPIKDPVVLGDQIDAEMAAKGEKLFNKKCSVCHEIHDSNRGPALGGVLEKRSPQFVMNMILDPDGMIENDPQIKALKAVYEVRMDNLHLTEEEAREIVEYLRKY
ncbi:cytochrome c [Aequorivita todarodis]|uniref:c-type cytochrome n=1 Tax=Aequorivita todarodis TaxID=2036821 RepID=UPI00234FDEDD|nr:cytochrome c [Aequorivita todarodis]MDC8002018.1 cytochrome c [Aequorivita todarodis]